MLPVNGYGINVVSDGLARNQEYGPGQLFRKFSMEAYSQAGLMQAVSFYGIGFLNRRSCVFLAVSSV